METVGHWTQQSVDDFVYSISASFTGQLERKMQEKEISRSELAAKLDKTTGRVSQVLNDPGNLGLRLIVEYAGSLGMKASVIAYDDNDPDNTKGPINPEVFVKSWEKLGRPSDLFEVEDAPLGVAEIPEITYGILHGLEHILPKTMGCVYASPFDAEMSLSEAPTFQYLGYYGETKPPGQPQFCEFLNSPISQETLLPKGKAA